MFLLMPCLIALMGLHIGNKIHNLKIENAPILHCNTTLKLNLGRPCVITFEQLPNLLVYIRQPRHYLRSRWKIVLAYISHRKDRHGIIIRAHPSCCCRDTRAAVAMATTVATATVSTATVTTVTGSLQGTRQNERRHPQGTTAGCKKAIICVPL